MQLGKFANLEKVMQGVVYFTRHDGCGHVMPWCSAWSPDFTDGSFWRPSDCFLMIPPANWECE